MKNKKFDMSNYVDATDIKIDEDELITRYLNLYGGTISDVLDGMCYKNQVLPKELKGLTSDAKFCGTALTVEGEPSSSTDPNTIFIPILQMLGSVTKNSVVITQPHDSNCSHLGELSATTIKARGGNGAVIYGGVRDVDYIHKLGLPVYHLYTTAKDVIGRWMLTSYNETITIANVTIHPEDMVFADKDGVIIIPKEITISVLLKAEELHTTENHVREDILKGIHPVEAYEKYGWF